MTVYCMQSETFRNKFHFLFSFFPLFHFYSFPVSGCLSQLHWCIPLQHYSGFFVSFSRNKKNTSNLPMCSMLVNAILKSMDERIWVQLFVNWNRLKWNWISKTFTVCRRVAYINFILLYIWPCVVRFNLLCIAVCVGVFAIILCNVDSESETINNGKQFQRCISQKGELRDSLTL